jgi:hypothetical protein
VTYAEFHYKNKKSEFCHAVKEEKNFFPLSRTEPRFLCCPALSVVTVPTELFRLRAADISRNRSSFTADCETTIFWEVSEELIDSNFRIKEKSRHRTRYFFFLLLVWLTSNLKMEAARSFERVYYYRIIRRHIPEENILHSQR